MTLRTEAIVPAVEQVMELIEASGSNGMFLAVTWDEAAGKLWVEMRSHWTTLGMADAAVRSMMQVVIDAVRPLMAEDAEARECCARYEAALGMIGGHSFDDFDVSPSNLDIN